MKQSQNNPSKLSELSIDDFYELLEHLKKFLSEEEKKDIKKSLYDRLCRFFPNMNTEESLILQAIVYSDTREERLYNEWQKDYPEQVFNVNGNDKLPEVNTNVVQLMLLENLYKEALRREKHRQFSPETSQIINAKNLRCLFNEDIGDYEYLKKYFTEKYSEEDLYVKKLDNINNYFMEIFGNNYALTKILKYCHDIIEKDNSDKYCIFFFKHVLSRIECMMDDKSLNNEINKKYYEILRRISSISRNN